MYEVPVWKHVRDTSCHYEGVPWRSLFPPLKCRDIGLCRLGCDRFLRNPSKFIVNLLSYISMLCSLRYWERLQVNHNKLHNTRLISRLFLFQEADFQFLRAELTACIRTLKIRIIWQPLQRDHQRFHKRVETYTRHVTSSRTVPSKPFPPALRNTWYGISARCTVRRTSSWVFLQLLPHQSASM